jgi:hypothetical protein
MTMWMGQLETNLRRQQTIDSGHICSRNIDRVRGRVREDFRKSKDSTPDYGSREKLASRRMILDLDFWVILDHIYTV